MALINNMYIFVESESVSNGYDITENKVEKGLPLTDHVERKAIEFSVKGILLDTDTQTAYNQYTKLRNWANTGTIVKYVGRNILDVAITSIEKDNDYKVSNGAPVSIKMKEIRIGKNSYTNIVARKMVVGIQGIVKHIVRRGETLSYIANKYGVKTSDIVARNKLSSNSLKEGMTLVIRG